MYRINYNININNINYFTNNKLKKAATLFAFIRMYFKLYIAKKKKRISY